MGEGVDVELHLFLTLAVDGSVQLQAQAVLTLKKGLRYPLNRRACGVLRQSGGFEGAKNCLPL